MKVEKLGFVEIDATRVFRVAKGVLRKIDEERQRRVDELVDSVMARKKPSKLRLWWTANPANIMSADTREEALEIAKKISYDMFDWPYWDATHWRGDVHLVATNMMNAAKRVICTSNATIMVDITTANILDL